MQNKEIERKFKVKGDFQSLAHASYHIKQGYLCRDKERTVRIRLCNGKGFLTIKGVSGEDGLSRYEFEQAIPITDAEHLFQLCLPGIIDKERFLVLSGKHTWEVDVFHGVQEGLIIAEIELESETETFDLPHWVGEEVTGDARYYNSNITKKELSLS